MSQAPTSIDPLDESVLVPVEVTGATLIDRICRFRVHVWQATGGLAPNAFPNGLWRDDLDDSCKHWVIMRDGQIVAAARWSLHPSLSDVEEFEQYLRYHLDLHGPIAAPARIVVCPSARKRGLARKLLDSQDQASERAGARYAVRQASPWMVPLLRLRGCRIVGPAALDPRFPGIEFQICIKEYPTTTMSDESLLMPVETTDPQLIDRICRFRVRVWAAMGSLAPNAFPDGIWRDELDDTCRHVVVLQGERILATARWSLHRSLDELPEGEQYRRLQLQFEGPIAVIERVVVCPTVPHLGLSRTLLDAIEQTLRVAGARCVLSQASPSMVRLARRLGHQILRPAVPDPRFPGVEFQIVLNRL